MFSFKSRECVVGAVVIAAVILGATFLFGNPPMGGPEKSLSAVFLTNNQVYFGTITGDGKDWLTLKNIYYIQKGSETGTNADVALMKLGNEVHGPEDMMLINRSQILFVEKLKSDGKMAKAIEAYRNK
jgi:hypothetical protein